MVGVDDNYYENVVCNNFVVSFVVNSICSHSSSNNSYIVVAVNDDDVGNITKIVAVVVVVAVNVSGYNSYNIVVVVDIDANANANAVVKAYNDNVVTYVCMVADDGSVVVIVENNYFDFDFDYEYCCHRYSHCVVAPVSPSHTRRNSH